jgi:hypothetical protein
MDGRRRAHRSPLGALRHQTRTGSPLIIAWGPNIFIANVHRQRVIAEARRNGVSICTIGPLQNRTVGRWRTDDALSEERDG